MSVEITVRFWAGAQRAAGHAEERMTVADLAELRQRLSGRSELARICAVATFLVDGQQSAEAARLAPGAVVDVLPPFAGG